jgi:hypothetical protein
MSTLAVETWQAVAVILVVVSAVALVVIVVAPWGSVRQEPPLDDEVESRILLGESPAEIEEELEEEQDERDREPADEHTGPGPAA